MEKWNYAELSKAAKAVGGPEKYVELIEKESRKAGRNEMLPWIGITAVGASLLTAGTIKIINIFKARKYKKNEEIEEIKKELIEQIKEYDAKNTSEEGVDDEQEISEV